MIITTPTALTGAVVVVVVVVRRGHTDISWARRAIGSFDNATTDGYISDAKLSVNDFLRDFVGEVVANKFAVSTARTF